MKIRTLLIDSNYLLKRSFNGNKESYTKSGHIGGLYSFLITLRKLIRENKINKVVLMWDGENGGKDRHSIDMAYKANRKSKDWYNKIELSDSQIKREEDKDESVLWQRKRIQAYAEELFLRQIEVDEIEADDLIASYCIENNNKEEIFIFTNDRDFSQLLDLNITIIFGNIVEPITKYNFFHKFGYHYSNALPIKVICGDVSDNIHGIDGIKENTLIKHFPDLCFREMSVKEICQEAKKLNESRVDNKKKPYKAFENLLNNIDRLKINYRLINLKEPFLNDRACEELEQLKMPLSPTGRGSKQLYKMMIEDEFLVIYGGTFVNFVEPFYTVIMHEKECYEKYVKNISR